MSDPRLLGYASAALEPLGARLVDFSESDVSVEAGLGMRKRRVDVPTDELTAWIEQSPDALRLGAVSFFRGIAAVVLAPRRGRREQTMGFREAAARMVPSLEGPLFEAGAIAAGAEGPFVTAAFAELNLAYWIELDNGRTPVTHAELERWGVSSDHAQKAALSLAFHRVHEAPPLRETEITGAKRLHYGDGCDAARALLLEQLFFPGKRSSLLFAVPDSETLLTLGDEGEVEAFGDLVGRLFAQSSCPLTNQLFRHADGSVHQLSA